MAKSPSAAVMQTHPEDIANWSDAKLKKEFAYAEAHKGDSRRHKTWFRFVQSAYNRRQTANAEPTKFFLVYYFNADGEDLNLVVEAVNKEQARKLWIKHYGKLTIDNPAKADIYPLPALTGKPHAIKWKTLVK